MEQSKPSGSGSRNSLKKKKPCTELSPSLIFTRNSMYKGQSVNERDETRMFVKHMDDRSKGFTHAQLDSYMDTTIDGYTVEQVGHMAWYLGIKHEQMLREKEMTMNQGNNQEPADEDEPEL